ncbi:MAG: cation:proton antiporter regulatory subunit [Bacillota bacterium]
MPVIFESDLPGIGRKFQVSTAAGDKLAIVVHDDGRRELFHFKHDDPDESISMVTLNDLEARQVAGIVGGLTYRPRTLEEAEVEFDDLIVEWYRVEPNAQGLGKTIGELQVRLKTGAIIIAVVEKDHVKRVNPGPTQVINEGATLVVVGERAQLKALRQLIFAGKR